MKSSVYNDRQLELDALGCSKPVETGESICNMLRAMETGDRPSCRLEDRLETVEQACRKTGQCRWMRPLALVLIVSKDGQAELEWWLF